MTHSLPSHEFAPGCVLFLSTQSLGRLSEKPEVKNNIVLERTETCVGKIV